MRERVHVNRTMKDLVADLRLMKSVLLSQYMPFLFAQRQEIAFHPGQKLMCHRQKRPNNDLGERSYRRLSGHC